MDNFNKNLNDLKTSNAYKTMFGTIMNIYISEYTNMSELYQNIRKYQNTSQSTELTRKYFGKFLFLIVLAIILIITLIYFAFALYMYIYFIRFFWNYNLIHTYKFTIMLIDYYTANYYISFFDIEYFGFSISTNALINIIGSCCGIIALLVMLMYSPELKSNLLWDSVLAYLAVKLVVSCAQFGFDLKDSTEISGLIKETDELLYGNLDYSLIDKCIEGGSIRHDYIDIFKKHYKDIVSSKYIKEDFTDYNTINNYMKNELQEIVDNIPEGTNNISAEKAKILLNEIIDDTYIGAYIKDDPNLNLDNIEYKSDSEYLTSVLLEIIQSLSNRRDQVSVNESKKDIDETVRRLQLIIDDMYNESEQSYAQIIDDRKFKAFFTFQFLSRLTNERLQIFLDNMHSNAYRIVKDIRYTILPDINNDVIYTILSDLNINQESKLRLKYSNIKNTLENGLNNLGNRLRNKFVPIPIIFDFVVFTIILIVLLYMIINKVLSMLQN